MSKKPETVELTEEERVALMQRLTANTLSDEDRALIGKCLNFMMWLQTQLTHAKISLDKLRKLFSILSPACGGKTMKKRPNCR